MDDPIRDFYIGDTLNQTAVDNNAPSKCQMLVATLHLRNESLNAVKLLNCFKSTTIPNHRTTLFNITILLSEKFST